MIIAHTTIEHKQDRRRCPIFTIHSIDDLLVTGSYNGEVFIWLISGCSYDQYTFRIIQRINDHTSSVLNARFYKQYLITTSDDNTCIIYGRTRAGSLGGDNTCTIDGQTRADSLSGDQPIFSKMHTLTDHIADVTSLHVINDCIYTGGLDGRINRYTLAGTLVRSADVQSPIKGVHVHGHYVLAKTDTCVHVMDSDSLRMVSTMACDGIATESFFARMCTIAEYVAVPCMFNNRHDVVMLIKGIQLDSDELSVEHTVSLVGFVAPVECVYVVADILVCTSQDKSVVLWKYNHDHIVNANNEGDKDGDDKDSKGGNGINDNNSRSININDNGKGSINNVNTNINNTNSNNVNDNSNSNTNINIINNNIINSSSSNSNTVMVNRIRQGTFTRPLCLIKNMTNTPVMDIAAHGNALFFSCYGGEVAMVVLDDHCMSSIRAEEEDDHEIVRELADIVTDRMAEVRNSSKYTNRSVNDGVDSDSGTDMSYTVNGTANSIDNVNRNCDVNIVNSNINNKNDNACMSGNVNNSNNDSNNDTIINSNMNINNDNTTISNTTSNRNSKRRIVPTRIPSLTNHGNVMVSAGSSMYVLFTGNERVHRERGCIMPTTMSMHGITVRVTECGSGSQAYTDRTGHGGNNRNKAYGSMDSGHTTNMSVGSNGSRTSTDDNNRMYNAISNRSTTNSGSRTSRTYVVDVIVGNDVLHTCTYTNIRFITFSRKYMAVYTDVLVVKHVLSGQLMLPFIRANVLYVDIRHDSMLVFTGSAFSVLDIRRRRTVARHCVPFDTHAMVLHRTYYVLARDVHGHQHYYDRAIGEWCMLEYAYTDGMAARQLADVSGTCSLEEIEYAMMTGVPVHTVLARVRMYVEGMREMSSMAETRLESIFIGLVRKECKLDVIGMLEEMKGEYPLFVYDVLGKIKYL